MVAYGLVVVTSFGLAWANLRHLRRYGSQVPAELSSTIDAERLAKISAYTADRTRLGILSTLVSRALVALFVFGGLLERYDALIGGLSDSFVIQGVSFFLGISWAEALIGLPFGLYMNFRVEARHGFNRMSVGLWWTDWIKGLVLSSVLTALAAAGALWLVSVAETSWWFWVWLFFVGFGVLLMYLAPYVIEPLFFKMVPLQRDGLELEVRSLAERAGVHVSRILTMDASRRSAHSNAYFTGIGRVKRVVLFDTLLDQLSQAEILSVLAHELGHWQKHHIIKRMLSSYAVALGAAFLAFHLVSWQGLPELVSANALSFPARIVVLGIVASVASFFFTPLSSWWSRRHEWEADEFASKLWGAPTDLANALAKLSRENLANLHPHPWYAAFYYSHPPVVERVRALRNLSPSQRLVNP